MKLLLHRINNNYCLRTCISIWDCNFSKNYIRKTPELCSKFFKSKMHSAHINNFIQILVKIWPTGNLNMRWSVVWWDHVTDVCRLFQLLDSLSYLDRFHTNRKLKMSNVELFLFVVKLTPTVNKKIICRNNDIPSPARIRLQESDILIIKSHWRSRPVWICACYWYCVESHSFKNKQQP